MATPKLTIEVETLLGNSDKTIDKYIKHLEDVQKEADKLNIDGAISDTLQNALNEFKDLKKQYRDIVKDFSDQKLNTEQFETFTKEIDSKMEEIEHRVSDAEEALNGLQSTIDNLHINKLEGQIKDVRKSFNKFKKDIKVSLDVLKEFQNLVTQSYGGKELKELSTTIKELSDIDLFDFNNLKKTSLTIGQLENKLGMMYQKYLKLHKDMTDPKASPSMIENAEKEIAQLLPSISELIKRVAAAKNIDPSKIFELNYDFKSGDKKYNFNRIIHAVDEGVTEVKNRIISRRKDLEDEVESITSTTAQSFSLGEDGIKIPIVLDEVSKGKTKDELIKFISSVSEQTEKNPIDIMVRFFPLKTNKQEAKEVEKHIKDIRAQIPKMRNKELAQSLSGFVDNLEKEYQKALMLKIKVDFSDDVEEVKRKIKLIETEAKNADINITPHMDLTEEETNKLKEKLEKIEKDFGIDFDKRLKNMADSLNRLFSEDKVKNWGDAFKESLSGVDEKLKEMRGLLEPLQKLYGSMTSKKEGRGRPSKEFLESKSSIDKFTETMDLLNKTLAERGKAPKLNAAEFIQDIQNKIDAAAIPVQVPVEPDIEGFTEQLEAQLKTIPVNLAINGIVGGDGSGGSIILPQNTDISVDKATVETKETKTKTDKEKTPSKNTTNGKLNGVDLDFIKKEFGNVYFGKKDSGKPSKKEREATSDFWDKFNANQSLLSDIENKNNEIIQLENKHRKTLKKIASGKGEPEDDEFIKTYDEQHKKFEEELSVLNEVHRKHVELNPFLSNVTSRKVSLGQKDMLLEKYLADLGITKSAKMSSKTYKSRLIEEVSGRKEKFNLRTKKDKSELENIVKRFLGFKYMEDEALKTNGGYKNKEYLRSGLKITDLTDNPEVQKQLQKQYDKMTGAIKKTSEAKQEYVRESEYEGISDEVLIDKQKELIKSRDNLVKRSIEDNKYQKELAKKSQEEKDLIATRLERIQNHGKIVNDLKKSGGSKLIHEELTKLEDLKAKAKETSDKIELEISKDNKKAAAAEEKKLKKINESINLQQEKIDKLRKSGQLDVFVDDVDERERLIKNSKKYFMDDYGVSEDFFKGINQKSKKKIKEMSEQIFKDNKIEDKISKDLLFNTENEDLKKYREDIRKTDVEIRNISRELELRKEEAEAAKQAGIEIQKETAITKENIGVKEESAKIESEVSKQKTKTAEAEKTLNEKVADAKAEREKQLEDYKKDEKRRSKYTARRDKNIQKTESTKQFASLKDFVSTADFRKNSNVGKQNLQDFAKEWIQYKNNKGKFNIIDLTDDIKLQDKLKQAVADYTASLKENKQAKEETTSTSSVDSKDIENTNKATEAVSKNTEEQKKNNDLRSQAFELIKQQKENKTIDYGDLDNKQINQLFNNVITSAKSENLNVEQTVEKFKQSLEYAKEALKVANDIEKQQTSDDTVKVVQSIEEEASAREKNAEAARKEANEVEKSNKEKELTSASDSEIRDALELSRKEELQRAQEFKKNNKKYNKVTDDYIAYNEGRSDGVENLNKLIKQRSEFVKLINQGKKLIQKDLNSFTTDDYNQLGDIDEKLLNMWKNTSIEKNTVDIKEKYKEYSDIVDKFIEKYEEFQTKQSSSTPSTDSELSLTERQIEALNEEALAIIDTINAKKKDKVSTEELIESYEKLFAINSAMSDLENKANIKGSYWDHIDRGLELDKLQDYIYANRGLIKATEGRDDKNHYWYNVEKHPRSPKLDKIGEKYSSTPYGEKFGQDYIDGILSTVSETREAASQLPENAKDATAEAQKSKSPSKVAEALGEYWGEGYANGILNTQAKVKNAVRALVETAKLTMDDLIKDNTDETDTANISKIVLDEINSGKNLTKMSQGFIGHIQNVDKTAKQKANAKGQMTKLINRLNNSDALTMDEIDKADFKFKEWTEKAEKLGVDTEEFKKSFKEARSKFILDEESFDKKDSEIKKETKYKVKEDKQSVPTTAKERKKAIDGLLKNQKNYYSELLEYEKKLAVAQINQNDDLIEHYKGQIKTVQSLYDETTKQVNALADENTIQQQAIKLGELRRKNENEIAGIIAKQVGAENKKKEADSQKQYLKEIEERNKQRENLEKESAKRIAEIEKNNLHFQGTDVLDITEVKSGVIKESIGWIDEVTKGDKWVGALNGADDLIAKMNELVKAEKELDEVSKNYSKAPDTYKEALESAKDNVSAIKGEVRDLAKDTSIESFSESQLKSWEEVDKTLDKIYEKRKANEEIYAQKQVEEAQKTEEAERKRIAQIQAENEKASQKAQEGRSRKYLGLQGRLASAAYDLQFEKDHGNNTEEFINTLDTNLQKINQLVDDINQKGINAVTEDDLNQATELLETVRQIRKQGKLTENRKANENSIQKNLSQINSILSGNTKLAFKRTSVYKDFINLQKTFKSFDTSRPQSELAELTTELLRTKARFEELDNTVKGKNFFQTFIERLHGTSAQLIAQYLSWMDIIRYLRTMASTIIDLDYQLVDLRKTTSMSTNELNEFYNSSSDIAKQLGVTTSEIISQAAAWSRLGYSTKEAATEMAQMSSKFAAISPGMTTEQSTDYLVSTMQAYGIAVDDVERKILDNVNKIGNTFATTNAEIGEMLTRSSAAMKAANNTLEETIALESAAVEITRNPETTGTAFRTVSMRIRGFDEETEEELENYEELKGKIADLTKTKDTPGGVSLFTDASKTEFKSTYQFLKDISKIWNQLTDKNQAQLLEAIGGKRGAQSLAGILADFSEVERAMTNMQNAAGSADKEMSIVEDSLQFKINALKQTWVGTLQELSDRGQFGEIIDFLTSASEKVGDLVTNFGLLQTAAVAAFTVIGTKNGLFFGKNSIFGSFSGDGMFSNIKKDFGEFKEYKSTIKSLTSELDVLNQVKSDLDKGLVKEKTLSGYISGFGGISEESKNVIKDTKSLDTQIANVGKTIEETKDKGSKLGNALKGIGINLLNAFASAAISTAISLAVTGISKLITSYEDLAKETQEVANKYNEQKTQLSDYSTEIKDLQEVMHNSASTTEEVKDATARLYEIQNDLIGTYPAYSEGINLVNGELENQLALLKEIDKQNANKALNEINGKKSNKVKAINLATIAGSYHGTGILGGVLADLGVKTAKGMITKNQSFKEARSHAWDTGAYGIDFGTKAVGSSTDQIRKQYEKFNYTLKTTDKTVQELAKSYGDIFTVDTEKNTITATGNIRDVNKAVQQFQTQLEAAGVTNEDVFNELTNIYNETNDRITQYADSYDTETQKQILNNKVLSDSYYQLSDAYNAIIKAQESGDVDKVEQLRDEYKELFNSIADNPEVTDRYLDYFKNLYPELQDLISSWEFEAKIKPEIEENRFGVNDLLKDSTLNELRSGWYEFNANRENKNYSEHTKNQYREIERLAADAGYTSAIAFIEAMKSTIEYADTGSEAFVQRIDNNSDGVPSEVVKARDEVAKSWYDGLEESERAFVDSLSKEDLAEVVKFSSTKQFDDWLKKCQDKAKIEVETEFKESSAVDSMADMKTAVTSLEDLWQQTVANQAKVGRDKKYTDANGNVTKQADDGNLALGYADPELINKAESAFYKFSEELKATGNDAAANEINAALEEFETTLLEFPNDATKAQNAIDKLITKYIDQTSVIKNLKEENAEWSEAQLTAMGITNAHEVVQSRLTKQAKYTIEAIEELSNAVVQYNSVMEDTSSTSEDKTKALSDLTGHVNNAIATYNDDGTISEDSLKVNDAFVKQHMADVQAMAEGDIEALNRVRQAAAKEAIMNIYVGIPTDVADEQINHIMDMVSQADAMEISPEAYIDDHQFLMALTEMASASDEAADAIGTAFESMGYDVEWISNRHQFILPKATPGAHGTTVYGGDKAGQVIDWVWGSEAKEYDIPSLRIKRKGSTGATAHYGGGRTTGGTGGGGGGNGGGSGSDSSANESEETFDWVEVAIKRVEDQINHLDEAVENVYSMWTNRNKKLRDEIAKTTKELEIQTVGAEIYKAKAEQVGLDKSYAKKIQQGEYYDYVDKKTGLRSTKSIETITDETLIKKIQEYQQWWDKYKQAQYAQQTLEIKLGDLYKKNFDQWKENYEEQINLIQSYADLIDKRITRVQEEGYFVSKKYYDELIVREKQNISNMEKELIQLIAARDEAVKTGRIKQGSQAWNEMTQEILGVAGAIEESTNNLVKFNNEIRQLNWDVFDFAEERIDQINQEADFLIDLLDNQKMYKDTGNFNQRGWAAVEMRAVKYDTYMQQSREYAKERAKIEKDLAKDPADKELIKRKEELIKLQQESIKNAYAEKEAVKDLVQEGRYLLSINLFNCWETLKTIIPQRKDEICLSVMV